MRAGGGSSDGPEFVAKVRLDSKVVMKTWNFAQLVPVRT